MDVACCNYCRYNTSWTTIIYGNWKLMSSKLIMSKNFNENPYSIMNSTSLFKLNFWKGMGIFFYIKCTYCTQEAKQLPFIFLEIRKNVYILGYTFVLCKREYFNNYYTSSIQPWTMNERSAFQLFASRKSFSYILINLNNFGNELLSADRIYIATRRCGRDFEFINFTQWNLNIAMVIIYFAELLFSLMEIY